MKLSQLHIDILSAAAYRHSLSTIQQLSRDLGASVKDVTEATRYLFERGVLGRVHVNVHRPLRDFPQFPISQFTWDGHSEERCPEAHLRQVARRVRKDRMDPAGPLAVVYSVERTVEMVGGAVAETSRSREMVHDLHVPEIYLSLRECDKQDLLTHWDLTHSDLDGWRSSDYLRTNGLRLPDYLPDAAVVSGGEIVIAFDWCTRHYRLPRLRKMWQASRDSNIRLDLW